MLKSHLPAHAPVIMEINTFLSTGEFPAEWKQALVTPPIKKPSLNQTALSSYRPVSNLPFISKVVTRVVAKQLTAYIEVNNLYPKFQSAYNTHHSVESALLKVHNDMHNDICH
jgi:hypothetical protein